MDTRIAGREATARASLARMITASRITQAVYVAAKLGLADQLARGPRSPAVLADALGANRHALRRLLAALASIGVVAQRPNGDFALTAVGSYLRSDVEDSLHAPTLLFGSDRFWAAWGRLDEAVISGEPTLSARSNLAFLERHLEDPVWGAIFDDAMSAHTAAVTDAIIAAYDFSRFGHLVDVGGGRGTLLSAILAAHPHARGTVFDLPPVADAARVVLAANGPSLRCGVAAGDFFESVPSGGDAYLLRMIIHDWDDERSVTILKTCRRAMTPDAAVLLIERVMPERVSPCAEHEEACFVDLNMLVITGGWERTQADYQWLLERAGFTLARIVPTACPFSVIEAWPNGPLASRGSENDRDQEDRHG